MDWYSIFAICFFGFPIARTAILVGPKSSVYPEGSNVTLQCLAEGRNRVVWEDVNENTVIFIDKDKNTQKVKFDNFVISNAEDNFSLTIVNAKLSDDGFYSCEEGDERRSANVTIEAGPDLSILVNNTERAPGSRITVTEDEQVFVVCEADGAKPAVQLKLKFGENEWIETNNTITNEELHFTTETRAVHRVKRNDTTVTCQATGQVSIPTSTAMISINVLHKPTCVIELGTNVAECQCVSNPAVTTFNWYIKGELQSTDPSLRIHEYIPANITCIATNEVGTSPLASRYVSLTDLQSEASSKNFAIIIAAVVVCVIVIAALLIILYKRSKHACKNLRGNEEGGNDAEQSTAGKAIDETHGSASHNTDENTPLNAENKEIFYDAKETQAGDGEETNSLLTSTSEKANEDPGLIELISQISTEISHDWEIFVIEDLSLDTKTVKEIIREYSEESDQLSAALQHWDLSVSVETRCHLEKDILKTSKVYNYYRERSSPNQREGENNAASGTIKTEKGEFDEQSPQVVTFSELVKEVGTYVGYIGAQRLSRQYKELKGDTFETSVTGESIIKLLQEEKLLIDDVESLSKFKKALDDSLLLRASHLVDTYMNKNDPGLKQLISRISAIISHDWEIFAMEDLSLKAETVKEIIGKYSKVSDQLSAALEHWVTSCPEASRSYLERDILPQSEVFDYIRARGGENNAASSTNKTVNVGFDKQFPQVETFSELVKEVVKYVGHIGAQRLSRQYQEVYVDSFETTVTGESIIKLLQEKNLLIDDMESLRRFKKAFDDSLLLRASHLVDIYMNNLHE